MSRSVKSITEGAMMCALVGVLLFINRQFAGILEYAMYWILSFPILIYTVKYGWKKAMIPAMAMLLLSFMISMPTTMFYLASALLCGMIYGHGVRKKWPNGWLLTITGILTLLSYLITMVIFAGVFGYDPQEDVLMAERLLELLSITRVDIVQIALLASLLLSVVTAILQTICVHLLAVMLLTRMQLSAPRIKPIYECTIPKWVGWISICIWLLFSLKNVLKLEGNSLVFCIGLYAADMIVLCAQCIIDAMCLSVALKRRWLGTFLMLVIPVMLFWMPTRIMIAGYGIFSILRTVRRTEKRGV